MIFLSTLSLRRATLPPHKQKRRNWISIHALLAESDVTNAQPHKIVVISIHALLAESDVNDTITNQLCHISIHALLAESDWTARQWISPVGNFYPRSPCGERHLATYSSADSCTDFYPRSPCGERRPIRQNALYGSIYFYPRSPCGERRYNSGLRAYFHHISIHALLAESDPSNFASLR